MNHKNVLVVVGVAIALVLVVLVVRNPIDAANNVREGWSLVTGAIMVVFNALATFVRQVFTGAP